MEYRRLGTTGLTVSRICLGCMSYGDPAATVAGALGVELSKEEVAALEAPYVAHPIAGFN